MTDNPRDVEALKEKLRCHLIEIRGMIAAGRQIVTQKCADDFSKALATITDLQAKLDERTAQVRVAYGFDRDAVFANVDAQTARALAAEAQLTTLTAENARLREAMEVVYTFISQPQVMSIRKDGRHTATYRIENYDALTAQIRKALGR